MRDRQYISSLTMTGMAIILVLAGLFAATMAAGWWMAMGFLAVAALFLAWFYWGPRPDLLAKTEGGEGGGSDDD